MKTFLPLIGILLLVSCGEPLQSEFDFLVGTWKYENRDQFEVWEWADGSQLQGYVYKLDKGEKEILETLSLEIRPDEVVYKARPKDQNEGRIIPFVLNRSVQDWYSFENPEHDFPNKIQYQLLADDSLQIRVIGQNGKFFSLIQYRVD